ncbi:hypothetical protein GCM10023093_02060 [Nemorincola caseinilytica]|uniref:DUF1937 domain-containing protein n=1 Tax=Nemorincola caseinilytica TaxID=2054315 RepID=A0ABP8N4V1_9BACT
MIIAVAGPYSAPDADRRAQNLLDMNIAAARVYEMGHIPFIGVNMALPVVAHAATDDVYEAIMDISMAVIDQCHALLLIGESPGALRERDHILAKGLPVYRSLEEIPPAR